MGCDCETILPAGTRCRDVTEFLNILGYRKFIQQSFFDTEPKGVWFYFFSKTDYKYLTGVSAHVVQFDKSVHVYTRTQIWRSKYDNDFHNYTIRQLKKRFRGTFTSDHGKNRYFQYSGPVRSNAEAGCYHSMIRFDNHLASVGAYRTCREFKNHQQWQPPNAFIVPIEMNPVIISNNLLLPFFVSAIEDYFKSSYIALLKYSPNKVSIFKNARIGSDTFIEMAERDTSFEDAICSRMSFQNINSICNNFKSLDKHLDLRAALQKPYRRQRETLFHTVDRIFNDRHALIHRSRLSPFYTERQVEKDIKTVEAAIVRVYKIICQNYVWPYERY